MTLKLNDRDAGTVVQTDEFGDFLVDGLQEGVYSVDILKDGYAPKKLQADTTEKDVSLGDIPLSRSER